MSDNGFEFTDRMVTVSNQLWAITSAVGAVLCFLVLLVILGLNLHWSSRGHLDRVSFRLLKWALVGNMFFGIFSAVGGSLKGPGFLCGFSIFVLQLTLEWSCFLLFAIALNLQLVVVHHLNGQQLEKYYVVGSTVLALAITVPPYAAKQYGWDPLVEDCWYTNDNQKQRLAWQIGTQLLWTGLTVIGEVVCALTVIVFMVKHQIMRRNLGVSSVHSASVMRSRSESSSSIAQKFLRPVDHANAYRGIIFRIGLYPLTSCIINLTSMMCVIHATVTNGVHSMTDYRILLLSDFLYGGRAVVYALLAATDPALLRAARAMISHMLGRPFPAIHSDAKASTIRFGPSGSRGPVLVSIELETVTSPTESYSQKDAGRADGTTGLAGLDKKQLTDHDAEDNMINNGDRKGATTGSQPSFEDFQVKHPIEERAERRRLSLENECREESAKFRKQI